MTDSNHLAIVRYLLEKGADPDQATQYGETPLLAACRLGNFEIIKCLVEAGADPSAVSIFGITPLAAAAYTQCAEAVEYLQAEVAKARHISVSSFLLPFTP